MSVYNKDRLADRKGTPELNLNPIRNPAARPRSEIDKNDGS